MKRLLLIAIVLGSIQSCTPPMYIPNATNAPGLRKQGDLEGAFYIGTSGKDVQAAYAITDEWGVVLNASQRNSEDSDYTDHLTHYFGEVGVGRSFLLSPTTKPYEAAAMFSLYGGGGFGHTEGEVTFANMFNSELVYSNKIDGEFYRAFLQPAIGLSSEYVDLFFTPRTTFVYVEDLWVSMEADWQQNYITDEAYAEYLGLKAKKPYNIFVEPTVTLRAGAPFLKGMLQLGTSLATIPNVETTFRQRPIIIIIGLQMDVNVLGKRKESIDKMPVD